MKFVGSGLRTDFICRGHFFDREVLVQRRSALQGGIFLHATCLVHRKCDTRSFKLWIELHLRLCLTNVKLFVILLDAGV